MAKSRASLLFTVLFCFPAINYYLAQILYAFGLVNPLANIIYGVIYATGLLTYLMSGNIKNTVLIIGISAFLLFYSCFVTDGVWIAITGPVFLQSLFMKFVGLYLPIVLLISSKNERFGIFMQTLLPVVLVVNVMCVVAFLLQVLNMGILQEYMTFAYTALPCILVGTYYGFVQKRMFLCVVSVIASLTIVFGGCRGALFALLFFYGQYLLFGIKKTITRIIVLLFCGLLLVNMSSLLNSGNSLLGSFGYESRLFSHLENASIIESESRNDVYDKAILLIDYTGNGIYSDRVLLEHIHDATYCHNWVLELLVDFGWILGVIIVVFVVFYLYKLIRYRPRGDVHYNFMIFFSLSMLLTKYMLSGSYLDSAECAMIIGWFIYCHRKKRYYAKEYNS